MTREGVRPPSPPENDNLICKDVSERGCLCVQRSTAMLRRQGQWRRHRRPPRPTRSCKPAFSACAGGYVGTWEYIYRPNILLLRRGYVQWCVAALREPSPAPGAHGLPFGRFIVAHRTGCRTWVSQFGVYSSFGAAACGIASAAMLRAGADCVCNSAGRAARRFRRAFMLQLSNSRYACRLVWMYSVT